MTGLIIDALAGWLGAALAGVLALAGAWWGGRRAGRQAAETRSLRETADADRRMDDADVGIGATDAEHMQWLRDRADKR